MLVSIPSIPVHSLVDEVGAQIHFVVHVLDAFSLPKGEIDQGAEPGFIELDRVGAGFAQQLYLSAQDRHASLHQLLAGGVGFPGVFRVPHVAPMM